MPVARGAGVPATLELAARCIGLGGAAPYPPSRVITGITWAPKESIVRAAKDSDIWTTTWADDGHLYTAYGDGTGFVPKVPHKLSQGLARIEGEPADVSAIAASYADWLATSQVPKLFVKAEPGLLIAGGANLDFARRLPAQTELTVPGLHFLQEDSPNEISQAIASWMGPLV